jgi:hypothetical protein
MGHCKSCRRRDVGSPHPLRCKLDGKGRTDFDPALSSAPEGHRCKYRSESWLAIRVKADNKINDSPHIRRVLPCCRLRECWTDWPVEGGGENGGTVKGWLAKVFGVAQRLTV